MQKAIIRYEGEIAGTLTTEILDNDQHNWTWESAGSLASRVIENKDGEMPNFLLHLSPEGELARILEGNAQRDKYINNGMRFLSNVTIAPPECDGEDFIRDRHVMSIAEAQTDHFFTGEYAGPTGGLHTDFSNAVGHYYQDMMTPKFSGAQLKLPMCLEHSDNGPRLSVANDKSFTHILKFGPNTYSPRRHIPVAEWMGLELSERCGLPTAEKALIQLPHDGRFVLAVERFDIPHMNEANDVSYYIQDMANVSSIYPHVDFPQHGKYDTPVEKLAEPLKAVSSDMELDGRALYKRIVFGYFLRDMDMHLKNLSILKKVDKNTGDITINFSPTYDPVPTIIFPEDKNTIGMDPVTGQQIKEDVIDGHVSLPINGKYGANYGDVDYDRDKITPEDFFAFAEKLGIDETEAEEIFEEIGENIARNAIDIINNPPVPVAEDKQALFVLHRAATEIVEEVERQIVTLYFADEFDYDRRFYHGNDTQFSEWYDENIDDLLATMDQNDSGIEERNEDSFSYQV